MHGQRLARSTGRPIAWLLLLVARKKTLIIRLAGSPNEAPLPRPPTAMPGWAE